MISFGPRPHEAAASPWPAVLQGAVVGVMASALGPQLGLVLPWALRPWTAAVYVLVGVAALAGRPWQRRVAWGLLVAEAALFLIVSQTPLAPWLLDRWVLAEQPAPGDAIVVLSASTHTDSLSDRSLERLMGGLALLNLGAAPRIVFTGDPLARGNRFEVLAPEAMRRIGLDVDRVVPFEGLGVTPMTTHLEAVAVSRMAARHGWRRVVLVTSPSHSRRAAAAFRRQGLEVVMVPSEPTDYDAADPRDSYSRRRMFAHWLYEVTALVIYQVRGWA